jgi:hypothetical protein
MGLLEFLIGLIFVGKASSAAAKAKRLDEEERDFGIEARNLMEARYDAFIRARNIKRQNILARIIGFTTYVFTIFNFASSAYFASHFASFTTLLNGLVFGSFFVFFSFRASMNWRKYSIALAALAIVSAVIILFSLLQSSENGGGMNLNVLSAIGIFIMSGLAWGIPALVRKSKADRASNQEHALDSISADNPTTVSEIVEASKKVARIPQVIGSVAILIVLAIAVAAFTGGRNDDAPASVDTSTSTAVPSAKGTVVTEAPIVPQATATSLPANINELVPGDYFDFMRKMSPAVEDMSKKQILTQAKPVCVSIVTEGKTVDEAAINLSSLKAFDPAFTLAEYIAVAELTNTYACPSFKAGN